MNVGFIGLGIMGKPMVAHLIKGGHALFLTSRSGVPQELISAGAKACASAKEVAQMIWRPPRSTLFPYTTLSDLGGRHIIRPCGARATLRPIPLSRYPGKKRPH